MRVESPPPADPRAPVFDSASAARPAARLPEEWAAALAPLGEPAYRGRQIFRWIHQRGVFDPGAMSDLGVSLRSSLAESGLDAPGVVETVRRAADGTRKLLVRLARGGRVECVLIPMTERVLDRDADASSIDDDADDVDAAHLGDDMDPARHADAPDREPAPDPAVRVTLCLSTQHGCAMGCAFCASGQAGLVRGLDAGEIAGQVHLAKRYLEPGQQLRNLVFMGMGEPLHHYHATARAIRLLTHPEGGGMSPRRITVSTVGLVPGIARLGSDFGGKVGLAVSLHAPDDATRDRIIPMNRRYPLAELMSALRAYPLPRRRRITIEYTLMSGVNDSLDHARALVRLLRGLRVKVNLIPMNPISASAFRSPEERSIVAFRELVAESGTSCFVRTRRGDDVAAACGQLAMSEELLRVDRRGRGEGRR